MCYYFYFDIQWEECLFPLVKIINYRGNLQFSQVLCVPTSLLQTRILDLPVARGRRPSSVLVPLYDRNKICPLHFYQSDRYSGDEQREEREAADNCDNDRYYRRSAWCYRVGGRATWPLAGPLAPATHHWTWTFGFEQFININFKF